MVFPSQWMASPLFQVVRPESWWPPYTLSFPKIQLSTNSCFPLLAVALDYMCLPYHFDPCLLHPKKQPTYRLKIKILSIVSKILHSLMLSLWPSKSPLLFCPNICHEDLYPETLLILILCLLLSSHPALVTISFLSFQPQFRGRLLDKIFHGIRRMPQCLQRVFILYPIFVSCLSRPLEQ